MPHPDIHLKNYNIYNMTYAGMLPAPELWNNIMATLHTLHPQHINTATALIHFRGVLYEWVHFLYCSGASSEKRLPSVRGKGFFCFFWWGALKSTQQHNCNVISEGHIQGAISEKHKVIGKETLIRDTLLQTHCWLHITHTSTCQHN